MQPKQPPWPRVSFGVSVRGRRYLGTCNCRSRSTIWNMNGKPATKPTIDTNHGAPLWAAMKASTSARTLLRVEQHMGRNAVRVEADLEGGVGQAHIQHTVQRQAFHGAGHGHAFEESLQGHAVADLGEQVFIGAEAVADGGRFSHVCSSWN